MRGMFASVLLICSALGAAAEPWSVVGEDRYGCKSIKDVTQLQLMLGIRSAFEIALAEKIESGACVRLKPGEPVVKIDTTTRGNVEVFKVKRADGTEYYVDARHVERTL